jgi:hypothetical protein
MLFNPMRQQRLVTPAAAIRPALQTIHYRHNLFCIVRFEGFKKLQ